MTIRVCTIVLILLSPFFSFAGDKAIPDYYLRSNFLFTSPSAFNNGLVGFANPANLGLVHRYESRFIWSTRGTDAGTFRDWGTYLAVHGLGFSVQQQDIGGIDVTDYRIGIGGGSGEFATGLSYGWSKGDYDALGRERLLSLGCIIRPVRYLSVGVIGTTSLESKANEATGEIGVRPLGTPLVTLFADGAIQRGMRFDDAPWSVGAAVQVVPGISLVGRYFESEAFTAGVTVDLGTFGLGSQTYFDTDQHHASYTHSVRLGAMQPSIFPELFEKDRRYLAVNMKGMLDYHAYRFFDGGKIRFAELLSDIQAAVDDPRVSTIALNLSSMRAYPEHAWEIREELRKAREAGIRVVIAIDICGMTGYHLASVADKIIMDPEGFMQLYGYALSRTFLRGTLDKLGVGFDEWRYFKYKSMAETYSRTGMSDADREQRQAFVDDWYNIVRDEICASRNIAPDQYDKLINENGFFLADAALEHGLVDTLARWSDIGRIISEMNNRAMRGIDADGLLANALPPSEWGPRPRIAVVYAIGACEMDSGIRGRWLERVFLSLARQPSVKAVVFRVDSPGGLSLPSDITAQALRKCAQHKPVIVSQGQTAASGGYWLSMYADTIVAGPYTLTGSIGVIGGWVYDDGFGEKTGMSADHVTHGEHADIWTGLTLPLLGLTLPARNLNEYEQDRVEIIINQMYDSFVKKVAEGRGLSVERVREIGEGRVYSGIDGKELGLVDEIGGLTTALAIAAEKAGLRPNQDIDIVEIPQYRGWFKPLLPKSPIAGNIESDPVVQFLKFYGEHNGQPVPLLLPGFYPTADF
ncbi:MAG: S49 family peptidase [candidate division Zixibacteria bacterium]|nr:S49 family peptidase [candidate division Zixibacteria bacterium]